MKKKAMQHSFRMNFLTTFLLAFGLLTITVPAALNAAPSSDLPREGNQMRPEHAPTPFSAEEIRDACNDGRVIKTKVEEEGKPEVISVFKFLKGDQKNAKFEAPTYDTNGKMIGKSQVAEVPWKVLQSHASFPSDQTEIRSIQKTIPAGTFDCWLYTVTQKKDGKSDVTYYWFAKSLPGPPILLIQKIDGKTIIKVTMIETGKK